MQRINLCDFGSLIDVYFRDFFHFNKKMTRLVQCVLFNNEDLLQYIYTLPRTHEKDIWKSSLLYASSRFYASSSDIALLLQIYNHFWERVSSLRSPSMYMWSFCTRMCVPSTGCDSSQSKTLCLDEVVTLKSCSCCYSSYHLLNWAPLLPFSSTSFVTQWCLSTRGQTCCTHHIPEKRVARGMLDSSTARMDVRFLLGIEAIPCHCPWRLDLDTCTSV